MEVCYLKDMINVINLDSKAKILGPKLIVFLVNWIQEILVITFIQNSSKPSNQSQDAQRVYLLYKTLLPTEHTKKKKNSKINSPAHESRVLQELTSTLRTEQVQLHTSKEQAGII